MRAFLLTLRWFIPVSCYLFQVREQPYDHACRFGVSDAKQVLQSCVECPGCWLIHKVQHPMQAECSNDCLRWVLCLYDLVFHLDDRLAEFLHVVGPQNKWICSEPWCLENNLNCEAYYLVWARLL